MKKHNAGYPVYLLLKGIAGIVFRKWKIYGTENIPEGGAALIGNHQQLYGPVSAQLYFPDPKLIWCSGEMTKVREVPDFIYKDWWPDKPKSVKWFYRGLSYVLAPVLASIFSNADTIPVYRDMRLLTTFRETAKALQEEKNVVLFVEHKTPYNNVLSLLQEKFVDIAREYYRKTGKDLQFVPFYTVASRQETYFLKPVTFDHTQPIAKERKRICEVIIGEVCRQAFSMPRHLVVQFDSARPEAYNVPIENDPALPIIARMEEEEAKKGSLNNKTEAAEEAQTERAEAGNEDLKETGGTGEKAPEAHE